MPRSPDDPVVERFRPTSGRVTGVLALLLAAAVVAIALVDRDSGFSAPVVAGAVLGGILAWAAMLRPGLWVTERHLVMQNAFETVRVPLAAIEELAVRQVLAVRAGDGRYVSTVVGRPLRKVIRRAPSGATDPAKPPTEIPYADFVEDRVRHHADEARQAAGVRRASPEQVALADDVRREPAWLVIGLIAAAALALVLTILL